MCRNPVRGESCSGKISVVGVSLSLSLVGDWLTEQATMAISWLGGVYSDRNLEINSFLLIYHLVVHQTLGQSRGTGNIANTSFFVLCSNPKN